MRRPPSEIRHASAVGLVLCLLGAQAAGCSGSDIVLGELGSPPASPVDSLVEDAGDDVGGQAAGARDGSVPAGGASTGGGTPGAGGEDAGGDAGGFVPGDAGSDAAVADAGEGMLPPGPGCGLPPGPPDGVVQLDGMQASYLLDLPLDYDSARAYPLVLAYRGGGVALDAFRTSLDLAQVMGDEAIVVYASYADDAPTWDPPRDLPLVDALLSELASSYCIDDARRFAVGYGPGAVFVNLLGCVRAGTFRAVAPLSGAPPVAGCVGNTAAWLVQSTAADPNMIGGGRSNRDYWAARNGCGLRMPTAVAPFPCVEFDGCYPAYPVRYCEHDGSDEPTFVLDALWSFFQAL